MSAWTVKAVRSPTARSHAGCLIECVCGCASAPEGFNNLAVFPPGFQGWKPDTTDLRKTPHLARCLQLPAEAAGVVEPAARLK